MVLLYILIAFAGLRLLAVFVNLVSRQWLRPHEVTGNTRVSILIPARNEEKNIGALLRDLKRIREEAALHPDSLSISAIKLIHGGELPEGWLGKNYACHRLAEAAAGQFMLFDAIIYRRFKWHSMVKYDPVEDLSCNFCYFYRPMLIRIIFIVLGTLSLILGITGIFIPGLPTTPFLLLTAGLYVRSSDKLYQRLIRNRYVGSYLVNWQRDKTLSLRTKVLSVVFMWIMILISVIFMTRSTLLSLLIILVGMIGTLVMGFLIPTGKSR